ncbi:MAG TPA: class I SAM-dependent methyltransferase [Terriglobales bacterium]|nr:class I SAM-dependent methyltransferase [Terriglobales bacterium]
MIASEVLEESKLGSCLRLAHPRIFFPSYVWEWTAAQLSAAAELTLDLCEDLIGAGWILKDAAPSNILFDGPRPIFVDVLSVERHNPENALWNAYGQFVRTFLLPLAALRGLGWPLSSTLTRRDGYEPEELYPVLGVLQRMERPWRSLVTLPVLLGNRTGTRQPGVMHRPAPVAQAILKHTLRSLRGALQGLARTPGKSRWSSYRQTITHYSAEDSRRKTDFVREALSLAQPKHVLDIGANTGFFSRLASETGARVVAWDSDMSATESAWRGIQDAQADVLPLVADFARPTPAAGWNNAETLSLLDRARGRFDFVMMLAILHHLLVRDQIPMEHIAKLIREMTRRWLLVEWVGPNDGKFQELSNGRNALYDGLNERQFAACFESYFLPVRRTVLSNERVLYLMEVK